MSTVLLVLVVVLVVAALVYGVVSLLSGNDAGLSSVEPDGRALPLPNNRSLTETDLKAVRFDVGWRGYRMVQVDRVLRRTAYDLGYKDEMIAVLEAETIALRDGRIEDAELLRKARDAASNPTPMPAPLAAALPADLESAPAAGDVRAGDVGAGKVAGLAEETAADANDEAPGAMGDAAAEGEAAAERDVADDGVAATKPPTSLADADGWTDWRTRA